MTALRPALIGVALFLAALAPRVGPALAAYQPSNDAAEHLLLARSLARGEGFTLPIRVRDVGGGPAVHEAFAERAPLYPALLSLPVRAGIGAEGWPDPRLQLLGVLLAALCAPLAASVAGAVARRHGLEGWSAAWVAVGAGLVVAWSPGLVRASIHLWAEPLGLLLVLAAARLDLALEDRGGCHLAVVAGVIGGLARFARPEAWVVVPLLLARAVWRLANAGAQARSHGRGRALGTREGEGALLAHEGALRTPARKRAPTEEGALPAEVGALPPDEGAQLTHEGVLRTPARKRAPTDEGALPAHEGALPVDEGALRGRGGAERRWEVLALVGALALVNAVGVAATGVLAPQLFLLEVSHYEDAMGLVGAPAAPTLGTVIEGVGRNLVGQLGYLLLPKNAWFALPLAGLALLRPGGRSALHAWAIAFVLATAGVWSTHDPHRFTIAPLALLAPVALVEAELWRRELWAGRWLPIALLVGSLVLVLGYAAGRELRGRGPQAAPVVVAQEDVPALADPWSYALVTGRAATLERER